MRSFLAVAGEEPHLRNLSSFPGPAQSNYHNGRPVTIYGQAERSSSTTSGPAEAMNGLAEKLAKSGDYDYVAIQRSLRTASGRVDTSRSILDVIGARRNCPSAGNTRCNLCSSASTEAGGVLVVTPP